MKNIVNYFVLLFSICLFSGIAGYSQSNTENQNQTYLFPTIKDTLNISRSNYYLSELLDLRTNKTNNGSIEINKIKYNISFQYGLPLHLSSFIYPQNNVTNSNLSPLSIQIEKLKCFASTDGKSDEGQLYIKINFIDLSTSTQVKTFENTFNYKKSSKTDFLADFMYSSFRIAFLGLRKKIEVYNPDSPTNTATQNNTNITVDNAYRIPLSPSKIEWNNPNYFLSTVEDARNYSKNEGGVSIGFFNQMATAKVDSSLEYYIKNTINNSSKTNKKPLSIQIKAFRISEQETDKGEQGSIYLSANFVTDSASIKYSIFNKIIQIDTINEFDITKQWPEIIKKSVKELLQSFDNKESKKIIPLIANEIENEIVVERFYYKQKYFYKGKELKKLSNFEDVILTNNDFTINQDFTNSIKLIRTGRVLNIVGATMLAYGFVDFLQVEDRSIKNWYKSNTYASNATRLAADKKILIWGGVSSIVSSFILRKAGKSKLLQTVGLYNKSLAKKISLNFVPNIQKQGYLFQLNYALGIR